MAYESKDEARSDIWQRLTDEGAARFPFPVEGRIPNFDGADRAAERLFDRLGIAQLNAVKINPDSPQKPLRRLALESGLVVFVPSPKLTDGFYKFDPSEIPQSKYADASALSKWDKWKQPVPLDKFPEVDLIITGCVAVTESGKRCGKGHGFSDIEFGILQELGHAAPPVATTVHDIQVVDDFPTESHDIGLDYIATPTRSYEGTPKNEQLSGIDWSLVTEADIDEMPVLGELQERLDTSLS
jgi:5-formyltetrahydrofolate cyclo-ligase